MAKKRNGEIDLLRFIFSVIIVIHHYNASFDFNILKNGYIAVEFFFLLSGYLMAQSAYKITSRKDKLEPSEIADLSWSFIIKKVKAFYPYYAFAVIFQVIVRNIFINQDSIKTLANNFLRSLPTFTLTFLGFNNNSKTLHVGSTWYLSAMIIAMFILFPFLLKNFHVSSKLFFPAMSMFVLGYLYQTYGTLANWGTWSGLCFNGVLRAVGEISFGASMFVLVDWLKKKYGNISDKNKLVKLFFTGIKLFSLAVVFLFCVRPISKSFNLHAYFFCAIVIAISFSGLSYCIPGNKFTNYLGKISLPIYIFHSIVRYSIAESLESPDVITLKWFVIMSVGTVIICVVLMYVADFVADLTRKITAKVMNAGQ